MRYVILLAFVTFLLPKAANASSQLGTLESELSRLGTDSALIVPSQAIDEYPLWSPDGNFLAANVEGQWYKFSLSSLSLTDATWRAGQKIGVLQSRQSVSVATEKEISSWLKTTHFDPREIVTKTGTKVQLKGGLGVSLIVQRKGMKAETLWSTDMENCHSLSLSPDEMFVAFISEMNGVVVMRLASQTDRKAVK